MDSIPPFSWVKNCAEVMSDFSSGPQFKNPNLSPSMTIVDATPPGVDEKLMQSAVSEAAVIDVWNQRRANGN